MITGVTESEFYMWRTLFAIAHADNVLSNEEIRFMAEVLEDVPFSDEQRDTLNDDIYVVKNPSAMFEHITDPKDQARFFKHARELVWIDGDFADEEKEVMLKLTKTHLQTVDFDQLIGTIDMELENDHTNGALNKEADTFKNKLFSKIGRKKGTQNHE